MVLYWVRKGSAGREWVYLDSLSLQRADDTTNKSLARFDAALKYVLTVYESAQGRKAMPAEVADLTNGIQITHAKLEANESL